MAKTHFPREARGGALCAFSLGMLPVYFTRKRYVLLAGKIARTNAALAQTTPARADLLIRLTEGPVLQRDLVVDLGVCPSVVTRMLAALEKLGLVKRSRVPSDRRLKLVALMQAGLARLKKLWDCFTPNGGPTLQWCAENDLQEDWQEHFDVHGVNAEPLAIDDKSGLLAYMFKRIRRTNYYREWFGPD